MKRASPAGIGVITILTVLLTLTLGTFAMLTLSSANADLRLSKAAADKTRVYYEADARAARIFAEFSAGSEASLETSVPISETQELILRFSRHGGHAVIDCWRVSVTEETPDDSLPVWTGD